MSLQVKFSAKDINLTETLRKVKEEFGDMDDEVKKTSKGVQASFGSMVKAGASLALGFGAIKVAANAIAGTLGTFKDALDLGGTMKDLSERTGETAGNLLLLRRAFDNSGVGADKVGTSVNKLQKFMDDAAQGSEKNITTLARLGLTMADMAGKTPTEQMAMLAERLNGVSDNGEKSALAMSVFGKAGGQLLPLLADFSGELKTAQDQLGNMPGVMDRNAGAFDNISDNINVAKGKFLEFAAGLLESLAPALELATTLITRFDAAGAGMKLGEIITGASNAMGGFTDALNAIKLGEFGLAFKITFESIKLQAADSINSIAANVMAAVQASGAFLLAAFGPGSGIYTIVSAQFDILSSKFQIAMIEAVKAIATALTSMFDTPLMNAARKINPILDSQLSAIEGISKGFEGAIGSLDKGISDSENKISNAVGQIGGDFKLAGQEFTKTFDQALNSSKQLIDTSAMEVKLQEHRVELKKLEVAAAAEAAKAAADKLTIEELGVKIGKERLTHEERIKELDADIASAKRQGNKEELAALEAMKAYHIELKASKEKGLSLDQAIANANKARQNIIDGVVKANKNELAIKKEITKELEKQLGLGQQIVADANAAQRKDRLDPGGQMEKQAREAIGKGNFAEARRVGRQLESRERNRAFQEAFGKKEGGIGRSVQDIAKEQGIDTFGKTNRQLQDELMKKRQDEMKPGAEGRKGGKPGEPAKPPGAAPENLLQKAVDAIKIAVESLEKKLPVPALGA
jgi:hypothetical protein